MAKKATKSKKSRSSSTSAASAKNPSTPSNQKMVLRVKSSEKMKRSAQQSVVSEREKRRTSKSRPKSKQKKKNTRIDAKMPKKPPTAFFYFFFIDSNLTEFSFFYSREDFRKEFQEQNPDIKSMRDIGRACGEKWKTMTYEVHALKSCIGYLYSLLLKNLYNRHMLFSVHLQYELFHVQPEKVKYYDIATEKRAEFDRAMAEYIKRKENGEDQETEDDSEFDE
ncbi:hypothetical protein QQP08_019221 [Theobroma cacao]|nr:hypothetical protein QQP08_019221 [Theobroma cacao]